MALFGPKPSNTNDIDALTYEIALSEQKLLVVEKESLSLDKTITSREDGLGSDFRTMQSEIAMLHEEIKHVRSMMKVLMTYAQKLIIQLQNKSKKEDLEDIEKTVDRWSPHRFITRNEFIRLAGTEITDALNRQRP